MADKGLRRAIWITVIIFLIVTSVAISLLYIIKPLRVGGEGVNIAILDSGIDMNTRISGYSSSRELKDRVILEKNFVTTEFGYEENESSLDLTEYKHGTLVALQIAGRSVGLGIAPQANLIIGKCASYDGTATYPAIYAAFMWAVEEADADIVNISLGGPILENDTIVDAINEAAKTKGVLTVISAGNSGDGAGYATSSIEGPGDALQAITVGATTFDGIADYSSIGPLKDHSIKPDLLESGFTLIAIGTSFSAPKIAARAAVLMSWCNTMGYKTTPGLLKAALMRSASISQSYPIYYSGAGVPNVTLAKTVITAAQKSGDIPLVSYVLPDTLPISITKAFRGDIWSFPLTIITSIEQTFTFTSSLPSIQSIIEVETPVTINQTSLVDCKFVIDDNQTLGTHVETIYITSNLGESLEVAISVEIEDPVARIGFDAYHSLWDMDHLLGQFSEMRDQLAADSIALIELPDLNNFSQLNDFDALIIPDPNTYGLYLEEDFTVESYYREFTNETLDYITEFVETGHGLFIMGTDNNSAALNETNRLLNKFNITITENTIPDPVIFNEATGEYNVVLITQMNATHPVTADLTNFDYLGASLNVIGENSLSVAWSGLQTNAAVIAHTSPNNTYGRVVVTGSNFMADNWAINSQYNSTHNLDFIINVVEWITNTTISPMLEQHSVNSKSSSLASTQRTSQSNDLSITGYQQINTNSIVSQNNSLVIETTIENKRKRNNCF
ncbi:MAG: S8 family serine peptidase [Candidatus Heimdallarchaeota archaeon]|nr:S8 family serine peptidase [Candidatus Heimdallarchaeota archaeon]